ncbi:MULTISPECIES: PPOX class F420-dependent oxidoreductase [Streptomyces]|uniref:PPOX class F420-dependent oxidoreductase n=1 Tax=Streptomyces TaxID=1883 RepID=UPI000CD57B84|nr:MULTISPECIES: PPOX class F420-dependent oxidoreductase [Streptomyces]
MTDAAESAPDELDRLDAGKYVLVTTYRRDGRTVPTPVWKVRDGDALGVWTNAGSGKVKRIRNRGDVLLAPCDARGNPTGPEVPGRAELLDTEGNRRYRALIARRYPVAGRLVLLGSRLRYGVDGSVAIRVTVN